MLYKMTLSKFTIGTDTRYISAPDIETAELFAEEQKDSYGCDDYRVSNAYAEEIPTEEEILYLD